MADLTTTTPDRSQDRSRKREAVTARGIGFVVLLSVVANLWGNYIEYVIHASRMTLSQKECLLQDPRNLFEFCTSGTTPSILRATLAQNFS